MANVNISDSLASDLIKISSLVHSPDGLDETEKKELIEVRQKTLAEIDAERANLNIVAQSWLDQIKLLITDQNWNSLPPVDELKIKLQDLKDLMDSIKNTITLIAIDINDIMSMLLEFTRKQAVLNKNIQLKDREFKIHSSENEFKQKEIAAKAHKSAELASAITAVCTAALQAVASAVAFGRSLESVAESKQAMSKTKTLAPTQEKLDSAVAQSKTYQSKISDLKRQLTTETDPIKRTNINQSIRNHADLDARLQPQIADLKSKVRVASNEIESLNVSATSRNKLTDAGMSITNAVAGLTKAVADCVAADIRLGAKLDEITAEKFSLQRNLGDSAEQSALDAYQQLRDALSKILQMLSAIEQSMSSMLTNLVKA